VLSLIALVLVLAQAAAPAAAAKPAFVIKADRGFIDDPFAIDDAGERLAVLRTDSASYARVDIVDLGTGATRSSVKLGDTGALYERVLFAGAGGVVVITRDPGEGRRSAQHYSADGKPLGFAGPVTDFAVRKSGGRTVLVAWDRRPTSDGGTSFAVAQHQLERLTRIGKSHGYQVGKDGMLAQPRLKLVAWQDGYGQVVGQRPGGYDKKKDVRQPDRAAVFDLLQETFVSETEIGDVLGWTYVAGLRRTRPNRTRLVVVTDEQDGVQLVDATGRKTPMALAVGFDQYDARSLREQEEADALYFSISIDPLNTAALARRKADPAFLDIYRVPGGTTQATRVLRVTLDDRPVTWVAGARHAAVLRKHKSFSRGGAELEVYPLAAN